MVHIIQRIYVCIAYTKYTHTQTYARTHGNTPNDKWIKEIENKEDTGRKKKQLFYTSNQLF